MRRIDAFYVYALEKSQNKNKYWSHVLPLRVLGILGSLSLRIIAEG